VHIMRTGGTALRERLINHFGELAVYPAAGVDGSDPSEMYLSVDRLRQRLAARGDEIRVITGHFPLRTKELISGPVTTLTLLRNPVDRMLSYLRQERDDKLGRAIKRSTPEAGRAGRPLEEIYASLHGLADNNMTKMFSLTPSEMSATVRNGRRVNREHLERAKEALTNLDAVGFQERFEDFCEELSSRFDWSLGDRVIVNTADPIEASESLRDQIATDNALDIELYEFARRFVSGRHEDALVRPGARR
jgi:hypothetical protein